MPKYRVLVPTYHSSPRRWSYLGGAAIVLLAVPLLSTPAAGASACERFSLRELSPGMSYETIRGKMGGNGVATLIWIPGRRAASVVEYPGPSSDLYVQYDHRIDRRPTARAVLLRDSLLLSPIDVQSLVDRVGPPTDGAYDLSEGLHDGAAVWIDEACGFVLTAYRPKGSWWAVDGGAVLQLETLEFARSDGSPAGARLNAILERGGEHAPESSETVSATPAPPPPPPELVLHAVVEPPTPQSEAPAAPIAAPLRVLPPSTGVVVPIVVERPRPQVDSPAAPVAAPSPRFAPNAPVIASPPSMPRDNAPARPKTIATWRSPTHPSPEGVALTSALETSRPRANPPNRTVIASAPLQSREVVLATAQTIATWRSSAHVDTAPPAPQSIAGWHATDPALSAPSEDPTAPAPRPITVVKPVYPPTAKWLGVKGHVILAVVVQPDGEVTELPQVVAARPAGLGFEEAAVVAVQKWRFNPAVRKGRPVEASITVGVDFDE